MDNKESQTPEHPEDKRNYPSGDIRFCQTGYISGYPKQFIQAFAEKKVSPMTPPVAKSAPAPVDPGEGTVCSCGAVSFGKFCPECGRPLPKE